jgi:hypothetical protein
MSSTYSPNLAIELIGTGDQAGTWGNTTNNNLGTLMEQAISGYVTQAITDGADTVLTMTPGLSATARNMFIECTGTLTAARNLVVPSNKKLYFIYNNTTGGFAVTVKVSGQTGVSVPNGSRVILVSNGTDVINATSYITGIPSPLPVSSGGTGVTTLTGLAYGNGTSAFTAATSAQILAAIATVPVANGGTGLTSAGTIGYVLTSTGTGFVMAPPVAATGGGSDQIFYLNGQTVTTNYTVPNSNNAGSFGPITINGGITVTVPTGSVWTVV